MIAKSLIELLTQKAMTLSTAESCTGGGLGYALTEVPGSSRAYLGGIVSYHNSVKEKQLRVHGDTLRRFGAVSEETAREMVLGLSQIIPADFAIAITGVAGPGADGPKPEGCVCFGVKTPKQVYTERQLFGKLGRQQVRQKAILHAIQLLTSELSKF